MSRLHYVLSMPEPSTHLLRVRLEIDGAPGPATDVVMPAWAPGSYKIRDYARNVQDFSAGPHAWTKADKSRWRVQAGGRFAVEYAVYAFELIVQGAHLDDEHAFVSGPAVFCYVDGMKDAPVTLEVRAPRGWKVATGLERRGGVYRADGYDVLADSPLEIGTFERRTFRVRGVPHELAIHGEGNHDPERLTADLKRLVEAEVRLMRRLPYERYVFLLHNTTERGGGLEHRNSAALQYPAFGYRPAEKYENFLELAAHEFFHLWNVKRIRPEPLGPFDYQKEAPSRLLWAMEGVTSYYDTLIPCRAGLVKPERLYRKLAERIRSFEEKPGRRRQSLSASSFDAWIQLYQPNENALNCQMSYYEKGELVAFCLDLEIRRRTAGRRSLDDVMRALDADWGIKDRAFPEPEFRRTCERVAGGGLGGFWKSYVDGVEEIPWDRFLRVVGLELHPEPKKPEAGEPARPERAWLGAVLQKTAGGLTLGPVTEGGPAWEAGLSPKDELVALDGRKIQPDDLEKRLEERGPGVRVRLAFFRGGRLRELQVRLGRRSTASWVLRPRPGAAPGAGRLRRAWLAGR